MFSVMQKRDISDAVLRNCCTHSRTVSSMKKGDPIMCEDCRTTVGVVR